ncbi:glucosyltransferase-I, partial [Streptococcus mutans SF12]
YMVTGAQSINGANYYFLSNGLQLRDAILKNEDGTYAYYGNDGRRYENGYYQFMSGVWRHFNNGEMSVGLTVIDGQVQYFDEMGYQAKGKFVTTADGKIRYFDKQSGNMYRNRFIENEEGKWLYLGEDGAAVTGSQTINGQHLYFRA